MQVLCKYNTAEKIYSTFNLTNKSSSKMSSTSEKSKTIIDLSKILNSNDLVEIKRMENEFQSHGWCFVLLPEELIPDPSLIDKLSTFFQLKQEKTKYSQEFQIYGYSKVNHKEGIKLLTGPYFEKFANKGLVPRNLVEPLNSLSQVLDAATKRLIKILDQHLVFQQTPSLSSLIERADLPLKGEHFGMLDIVSYFNNKHGFKSWLIKQTTNGVNCVPHYDPGLLSISILSTHEGLQLKNMTNDEWIDGPLESHIGVIWLGEAASRLTENRLKPGIHRVIYPQESKSRLTVWYELCTIAQLQSLSGEKKNERMEGGTVTFDNLPGAAPITVKPGEKKLDFLKRVEEAHGLSMSKVGPPRYQLPKYAISYPNNNLTPTDTISTII